MKQKKKWTLCYFSRQSRFIIDKYPCTNIMPKIHIKRIYRLILENTFIVLEIRLLFLSKKWYN